MGERPENITVQYDFNGVVLTDGKKIHLTDNPVAEEYITNLLRVMEKDITWDNFFDRLREVLGLSRLWLPQGSERILRHVGVKTTRWPELGLPGGRDISDRYIQINDVEFSTTRLNWLPKRIAESRFNPLQDERYQQDVRPYDVVGGFVDEMRMLGLMYGDSIKMFGASGIYYAARDELSMKVGEIRALLDHVVLRLANKKSGIHYKLGVVGLASRLGPVYAWDDDIYILELLSKFANAVLTTHNANVLDNQYKKLPKLPDNLPSTKGVGILTDRVPGALVGMLRTNHG
jgi:hypothetical protein